MDLLNGDVIVLADFPIDLNKKWYWHHKVFCKKEKLVSWFFGYFLKLKSLNMYSCPTPPSYSLLTPRKSEIQTRIDSTSIQRCLIPRLQRCIRQCQSSLGTIEESASKIIYSLWRSDIGMIYFIIFYQKTVPGILSKSVIWRWIALLVNWMAPKVKCLTSPPDLVLASDCSVIASLTLSMWLIVKLTQLHCIERRWFIYIAKIWIVR